MNEEDLLKLIYQDYSIIPSIAFTRKSFVLNAVKYWGLLLYNASDNFKKDQEVVLAAIKQNVNAFRHASWILRNNKQFVLNVVKRNGLALSYVSEILSDDEEIVFKAIKQNFHSFQYASKRLRGNKQFVLSHHLT